jgi:tetratricopeptide (TPR) repeat protein/DNA-binding winged helix-turn-helix (wHTH) protein
VSQLDLSACAVNLETGEVAGNDHHAQLRPREVQLLGWLSSRPGEDLSRDEIHLAVWKKPREGRVLDVTVRLLRQKVEVDPSRPDHILTVHGVGYRFEGKTPTSSAKRPPLLVEPPDRFFGRGQTLRDLGDALASPGTVLLLRGPGGMGKSRLAKRCLREHADRNKGWFVDLADCRTRVEIQHKVASALGVMEANALGDRLDSLGAIVVVLDNVERISDEVVDLLSSWRRRAPGACWLLTSRAPVGLEDVIEVELPALTTEEGVDLMLDRARARAASWKPGPGEAAVLRTLAAWLDGLPLALEMAGSQLPILGTDAILTRVRAGESESTRRDLPERHLSLDRTISGSWESLSADARAVLRAAGLVRSTVNRECVTALVEAETDPGRVRDALAELARSSLLGERPEMPGHYRMYEGVRRWVRKREGEHPNDERLRERHARWALGTASSLSERRVGPAATLVRAQLRELVQDLLDASRWFEDSHPGSAATCSYLVHQGLHRRGPFPLQRFVLEQGVLLAGKAGDRMLETRCRAALGEALSQSGKRQDGGEMLEQALVAARELNAPDLLAEAALLCGRHRDSKEELASAEQVLLEGLQAATEDKALRCALRVALAQVRRQLGKWEEAEAHLDAALIEARACEDAELEAEVRSAQALLRSQAGDGPSGHALFQQALSLFRAVGNPMAEAAILGELGKMAWRDGKRAAALDQFGEVHTLALKIGALDSQVISLRDRGGVLAEMEQFELADTEWRKALQIAESLGRPRLEGLVRLERGVLAQQRGNFDTARRELERAVTCWTEGSARIRAVAYLAAVHAMQGDEASAETLFQEARAGCVNHPQQTGLVDLLEGVLLLRRDDHLHRSEGLVQAQERLQAASDSLSGEALKPAARILRRAIRDARDEGPK